MPDEFENRIKYMGNDVDIWEMAKIFLNLLRYLGHSSLCWKCLKNWRKG